MNNSVDGFVFRVLKISLPCPSVRPESEHQLSFFPWRSGESFYNINGNGYVRDAA